MPALDFFKHDFYLAGGTALALQIGHRTSVDFDFFSQIPFDLNNLRIQAEQNFQKFNLQIITQEKQTLEVLANGIKISFFYYPYPLLNEAINIEHLRMADQLDIGLMKLSAITQRSVLKDFVDLYLICQNIPLTELLAALPKKMPALNLNPVLKSLVYFDELEIEPLFFLNSYAVSLMQIKNFFTAEVKLLLK